MHSSKTCRLPAFALAVQVALLTALAHADVPNADAAAGSLDEIIVASALPGPPRTFTVEGRYQFQ